MDARDETVLPPGTRIDQYVITGILGRGGFGITYLIRDEMLNREFALKEFFPEDLVRREGRSLKFRARANAEEDYRWGLRKFFDEARLLAQFNHPNIIGVRRVFEANDTAYMVLDLVRGVTLERWLRSLDGRPTQDEIDLVAAPLLSALALVHENRTWHLDISPENIMIRGADGAPILLDFGASRFEIKQHSQLVSALVFKCGYSAPEQYTSNADRYGPWTDIYAFAATLYRAVTGERPAEATARQLSDDLTPAVRAADTSYRKSFLAAIDGGLRLSPAERPQSVADWRAMLLAGSTVVPEEVSTVTRPTTAIPQPQPQSRLGVPLAYTRLMTRVSKAGGGGRKRRGIAGMLAALLALLVVGGGAALLASSHRSPFAACGGMFSGADCWAAVVDNGGNIFARVEEPSRAAAEAAALKRCSEVFDQGCKVIATLTQNECWALAEMPSDPTRWRASAGQSMDLAQKDARWACERAYGMCEVALTFCADGKRAE